MRYLCSVFTTLPRTLLKAPKRSTAHLSFKFRKTVDRKTSNYPSEDQNIFVSYGVSFSIQWDVLFPRNSDEESKWEPRCPYSYNRYFNCFTNYPEYSYANTKSSRILSRNIFLDLRTHYYFGIFFIRHSVSRFRNPLQKTEGLQVFREALLCVCLNGTELESVSESWIPFDQRKCIFIPWERRGTKPSLRYVCQRQKTALQKTDNFYVTLAVSRSFYLAINFLLAVLQDITTILH